jgi:hypothetical protein
MPLAFRVLVVSDSVESASALSALQGCDEGITACVQEIIFCGDPKQVPDKGDDHRRGEYKY